MTRIIYLTKYIRYQKCALIKPEEITWIMSPRLILKL